MNDEVIIIPPDADATPGPNALQRWFDGLSIKGKKYAMRVAGILGLAATVWVTSIGTWGTSEPIIEWEARLMKPFDTMKDEQVIALFGEYGIDINTAENRKFFRLEYGQNIWNQLARNFWENFLHLLKDRAFRDLFVKELESAEQKRELWVVVPAAIAVEEDAQKAIPVVEVIPGEYVPVGRATLVKDTNHSVPKATSVEE